MFELYIHLFLTNPDIELSWFIVVDVLVASSAGTARVYSSRASDGRRLHAREESWQRSPRKCVAAQLGNSPGRRDVSTSPLMYHEKVLQCHVHKQI